MTRRFSEIQIETTIATLFHIIGLIGILFINKQFFSSLTFFNLILSFILLFWTHLKKGFSFYLFLISSVIIGFVAEVIGVNTGFLFGNYHYENLLGISLCGVPLIIGINWFVIIYCSGNCMHTLLQKMISRTSTDANNPPAALKALSVIVDGATLAVFFDWVMEPVAVKLGFWKWESGSIPLYNYISWLLISMLILLIFHFSNFKKGNKFAINLFLIQLMFFLVLRTFLK